MYLRELLRMMEPQFYAHVLLEDDAMDMLFCHRWLLLCFKREFFNEEVLKMWEACWSRYQTDYFHIFLCVAMVGEYGREVVEKDMPADEMLQYFTNLSMNMDGRQVLRKARQLLLKFRQLPCIPCTVRGLLSGPGIWDSAPLPEIECNCHGNCCYARSSWQNSVNQETEKADNLKNVMQSNGGSASEGEKEKYEDEISEKGVIRADSCLKEDPDTRNQDKSKELDGKKVEEANGGLRIEGHPQKRQEFEENEGSRQCAVEKETATKMCPEECGRDKIDTQPHTCTNSTATEGGNQELRAENKRTCNKEDTNVTLEAGETVPSEEREGGVSEGISEEQRS